MPNTKSPRRNTKFIQSRVKQTSPDQFDMQQTLASKIHGKKALVQKKNKKQKTKKRTTSKKMTS